MKDMEYISMERAIELAKNNSGVHALCKAAIADYLNGVVDGVVLPELTPGVVGFSRARVEQLMNQAIAPYAARLAQAERNITRLTMLAETDKASADHWRGVAEEQEAVLRMAKGAMVNNDIQVNVNSHDYFKAIAAINQQLGEK